MKKPRLFYYEEAVDNYIPVPDLVENIVDVSSFMADNETIEIIFKRIDMTDDEFKNLPEA